MRDLGLSLLILSAFGFGAAARLRWLATKAARWGTTSGVVDAVDVQSKKLKPFATVAQGPASKKTRYRPRIAYTYEVKGVRFRSEQVRLGARRSTTWRDAREAAERELPAYRVGQAVDVHFDPADPRNAALDLDVEPRLRRALLIGTVLLAIGLALLPF